MAIIRQDEVDEVQLTSCIVLSVFRWQILWFSNRLCSSLKGMMLMADLFIWSICEDGQIQVCLSIDSLHLSQFWLGFLDSVRGFRTSQILLLFQENLSIRFALLNFGLSVYYLLHASNTPVEHFIAQNSHQTWISEQEHVIVYLAICSLPVNELLTVDLILFLLKHESMHLHRLSVHDNPLI